jgi:xylulokinase
MFLGVDIGTQSLKAVIADANLGLRGVGQSAYRPTYPRPGWAEQNSALWLDALAPAIAQALATAGLAPDDIRGMGICGQLDGCIGVTARGEPIAPAIIWMDRRATAETEHVDPGLVRERAGLVLDATHMAAKIRWSERHLPRAREVVAWHQPVSYVVEVLTGARVIDHSLASTTMLYSLAAKDWDAELLERFGVDRSRLPALGSAGSVAGALGARGAELTGLRPGLPVAVGTGDDFSNPLGCGITAPGTVAVTLGTGEAISALSATLAIDPEMLVETHAYPAAHYHLGNPGWLSGGAVSWFLATFSVLSAAEFSALAAEALGAFYGLTAAHTKAHLARAVLEGTSFAMRDVIERLGQLGVPLNRVRLMGGGAASALWAQIRADLIEMPVETLKERDTSAMGAAVLALAAAGEAPSVAAAAERQELPLAVTEPIAGNAAVYENAYVRYRKLFASLEPMFV